MNRLAAIRLAKSLARKAGVRRYKPKYGVKHEKVADFFSELNKTGIKYLALRWYEDLPEIEMGNDIDILVEDNSFQALRKMCSGAKKSGDYISLDIFSVSNQVGDYAYYVPYLANRLIETRVQNKNGIWVPDRREYFFSLAYHALFHKGFESGIPSKYRESEITAGSSHDFVKILSDLAREVSIEMPEEVTMESLEALLGKHDWLPPLDAYYRCSKHNPWVYNRVQEKVPETWRKNWNTVVFIVREKAVELIEEPLIKLITKNGAEIVRREVLNHDQARAFMSETRGGDWGMDFSDKPNAGLAKLVLVAKMESDPANLSPEPTPAGVVEYDWVMRLKREIRDVYELSVPKKIRYHFIHTSDNGVEAAYYTTELDKILGTSYGD